MKKIIFAILVLGLFLASNVSATTTWYAVCSDCTCEACTDTNDDGYCDSASWFQTLWSTIWGSSPDPCSLNGKYPHSQGYYFYDNYISCMGAVGDLCGSGCTTHDSKKCYGGDVWWYDSCGVREDKYDDCKSDEKCENAKCVEDCDSHDSKKCYNDDVYWYDSCGDREEKYADCDYGCTSGKCNPAPSLDCSDGTSDGDCSLNQPKYCNKGTLINQCDLCGCPQGQFCDMVTLKCGSQETMCDDGTVIGECSTTYVGKRCIDNGTPMLVDDSTCEGGVIPTLPPEEGFCTENPGICSFGLVAIILLVAGGIGIALFKKIKKPKRRKKKR